MTRQTNPFTKSHARWERLIQQIISKMCGADDYGLIDEALVLERLHDALTTALPRKGNAPVRNCLSDYFGAPNGQVDLERERTIRRHLLSPLPSGLHRYFSARNDRVASFRNWNSVNRTPEQLVQDLVCLAKNDHALGGGVNHAYSAMRAARKKEIRALKEAIESCLTEGPLSDPKFVPWQLGHVFLFQYFAIQDLETTPEQCKALNEKIKLLKNQQRETEHAP